MGRVLTSAMAFMLALAGTALAEDMNNAGPYRVRRVQPACQNVAVYDDIMGSLINTRNPADQAEGWARFAAHTDHRLERNQGSYCLSLPAGKEVWVEKRNGRYECVRWPGMPVGDKPYHKRCYWTVNIIHETFPYPRTNDQVRETRPDRGGAGATSQGQK